MKSLLPDFLSDVSKTKFEGEIITNIEMETAAYYAFSASLGHEMISLNAILANRLTHEFSKNPESQIIQLIELTLDLIA
jgi:uridine phosphorylase